MYKNIIIGKKAVFFDLDGTLVDSEPIWNAAFYNVMITESVPITPYSDLITAPGISNTYKWENILLSEQLKSGKTAEQLTADTNKEFLHLIEGITLEPREGFWELAYYLKLEKNLKLGLTTNTSKDIAEKVLAKMGIIETFDFKIFGDDVKKLKPDPEMYLKALSLAGIKSDEALVFEDSLAGAAAADAAKLDLIVIWDTDIAKSDYPKKTQLFMLDFGGLANNLEFTFEEAFNDFQKQVLKNAEEKEEKANQQTQKQLH